MQKLDIKTKIFLYITKAHIVSQKQEPNVFETNVNDVYIFENYEEYKNYFKKYIKNIKENLINEAIYTIGKHGEIIALKKLCEKIILKEQAIEFYKNFTKEQEDEIHNKGMLTPYEKVEEWLSYDLCMPGDNKSSAKERCRLFLNCKECLLEYASSKQEYEKLDFKLVNSIATKEK